MKSTMCGVELLGDRGGIIQLNGTNTTPNTLKKNGTVQNAIHWSSLRFFGRDGVCSAGVVGALGALSTLPLTREPPDRRPGVSQRAAAPRTSLRCRRQRSSAAT